MKPIHQNRAATSLRHDMGRTRLQDRRGTALFVVLLLLSLTVGLSYAAMRSQYTAGMIQRNSNRRASARQAAATGITMALKKMHHADWAGVDTSLNGSLSASESFLVTYTAGDPTLGDADPDQPYRVTLFSTGYAVDSEHPQSIATHEVRAIVRLIPRQLATQPSDWDAMQGYTLYQTKKEDVELDIPCRFTGPARLQKKLRVAKNYPDDNDVRSRYLVDLNQMRLAGQPDYRPMNGPVYLPFDEQDSEYFALLTSDLGVTAVDTPAQEANTDWVKPPPPTSYRIYPGGPVYTVQNISDSLYSTTLKPAPQNNPLGIFYRDGNVAIKQDVTIQGSLFCKDELRVEGGNFLLEPILLPALAGSTEPVRLAAVSCQNSKIKAGGGGQIAGLVAVFDKFEIEKGSEDMAFALAGQLVTRKLYIRERTPWGNLDWEDYYEYFQYLRDRFPSATEKYFPNWMAYWGRSPVPRLTFAPESTATTYHWANAYDPIFVPHPDDDGMRWDLLEWSENP